jgi:S-methylmethionine-dependent homocysteine/selenocysteine methylase
MDIETLIRANDYLLMEAAVIETLRHSSQVALHPRLENALLMYTQTTSNVLATVYNGFIGVAAKAKVPILITTPTWRANRLRLTEAHIGQDVNGDAVRFLKEIRAQWPEARDRIAVGGLVGCRNDSYRPEQGLSLNDAMDFHAWQVDRLAAAGADFLMAATMPALPEAAGMARAMESTGLPYIISFVIDRRGLILDGTPLAVAFDAIDAACQRPPLGFMINCAYPSFLNAASQPDAVMRRLVGYQANASSRDHAELDGADELQADDLEDWGRQMIALNRVYGIKILGGCCGTGRDHLRYITGHRDPGGNTGSPPTLP